MSGYSKIKWFTICIDKLHLRTAIREYSDNGIHGKKLV